MLHERRREGPAGAAGAASPSPAPPFARGAPWNAAASRAAWTARAVAGAVLLVPLALVLCVGALRGWSAPLDEREMGASPVVGDLAAASSDGLLRPAHGARSSLVEATQTAQTATEAHPDAAQNGAAASATPLPGNLFFPGKLVTEGLGMTRTDVLKRCYLPPRFHVEISQGCTVSDRYRLVYHLTPQTGSSTGRHVLKNEFEGRDWVHGCERLVHEPGWTHLITLRNPTTRAFAAYEEMLVRNVNHEEESGANLLPPRVAAFFEPFRGKRYADYAAMFETREGVAALTRAYERFMRDWDGTVFDVHLASQVAYAFARGGDRRASAAHISRVFDTHLIDREFRELGARVGLPKPPRVIRGRAYPRRLNVSDVSDDVFQKMCLLYAIDYCCLDYELPPACLRAAPGKRVACRWVPRAELDARRRTDLDALDAQLGLATPGLVAAVAGA